MFLLILNILISVDIIITKGIICFFSLLNWFYSYEKWGISTTSAFSFNVVKKGNLFITSGDATDSFDKVCKKSSIQKKLSRQTN